MLVFPLMHRSLYKNLCTSESGGTSYSSGPAEASAYISEYQTFYNLLRSLKSTGQFLLVITRI